MNIPDIIGFVATATIDELGRMLIPIQARILIGCTPADKLEAIPDELDGTLLLYRDNGGNLEMDDFGRVVLEEDLRSLLGWAIGQQIEFQKCNERNCLVLMKA